MKKKTNRISQRKAWEYITGNKCNNEFYTSKNS